MRRPSHVIAGVACVLSLVTVAPIAVAAAPAVPPGFVGMNLDGPIFSTSVGPGRQVAHMVASGVESVRVVFDWSIAQPYPNWKAVPVKQVGHFEPGAVPTSFAATDTIVELAAQHGLSVLPIVLYTPGWDQLPHPPGTLGIPARDAPYAHYVRLLVRRYGPHGSFWSSHREIPRAPIRMWQIWNEPNTRQGWPSANSYVSSYLRLLRAAHSAIKRADPGAKVVLAGMPNFVWQDLARLYEHGARDLFDLVAVHPYTRTPQGVITILRRVREVMDRHGDRPKPIVITEFGWPSSLRRGVEHLDFEATQAGQAQKLGAFLSLLVRDRPQLGVTAFYYYTWISDGVPAANPFAYAGLLSLNRGRVVQKPALGVFRRSALALEACRQKAAVATRCAEPG